jgi:hypothetical protein
MKLITMFPVGRYARRRRRLGGIAYWSAEVLTELGLPPTAFASRRRASAVKRLSAGAAPSAIADAPPLAPGRMKATNRSSPAGEEPKLVSVLLIGHLLHPVDGLSVQRLGNRDVSHSLRRRRAVPMFDTGRKPDHIARQNLFPRSTFDLHPSAAHRDDQRLAERMRVPSRARAGSNVTKAPPARAGSVARNGVSTRTDPVKCSAGPFRDGWELLRVIFIISFFLPCAAAGLNFAASATKPPLAARMRRRVIIRKTLLWLRRSRRPP